ncbi:MAG: cytochrome o ubiquinol oxidase subunit I, partial [Rhabdochlamydiaceae bacterium]
IKQRKQNIDTTGDPWNGRTLEWSTKSPPPLYNFARLPEVNCRDPFWVMKEKKRSNKSHYEDIHVPRNTPMGLIIGGLSIVVGFALVWYMMWLALIAFLGIIGCLMIHLSNDDIEYVITAQELEKMENKV